MNSEATETGLHWHVVEMAINREIEWLQKAIKGRADLGVYKDGYKDLFIEVGTTSAYKLWWNLQMSTNCKILLVPEENYAIEFTCRTGECDMLRGTKAKTSSSS